MPTPARILGVSLVVAPVYRLKNAHDDRDEARVGVVRDGAKEGILVHVGRREERGATLVHDYNNLHTPSRAEKHHEHGVHV